MRIRQLQSLLDPQVREFYKDRLDEPPEGPFSLEEMRRTADLTFNDRIHKEPIAHWEDREISCRKGRLPIRIFYPSKDEKIRPLVLYFHGGGFVIHNIKSHDDLCLRIANEGDCVVASVGYRLAPEHPWPACMEDGYDALQWAFHCGDELPIHKNKIILAGDSAGASISAVLSLMERDERRKKMKEGRGEEKSKIALQILCYGSFGTLASDGTDLSRDSHSIRQFGNGGFVLPKGSMDWFMSQYVPLGIKEDEPYLFAGRATELSDLPRTLCITAQCDPLRDDGEAFAKTLCAWGNDVTLLQMKGMMHGFLLYWYRFDRAKEAISQIGKAIRAV